LKRSASGVQRLTTQSSTDSTNGVSPPVASVNYSLENLNKIDFQFFLKQSSVQAARKNVQSTAELVAQLSEQLPQHIIGIFDLASKEQPTSVS
jgi:hypothetical protein